MFIISYINNKRVLLVVAVFYMQSANAFFYFFFLLFLEIISYTGQTHIWSKCINMHVIDTMLDTSD